MKEFKDLGISVTDLENIDKNLRDKLLKKNNKTGKNAEIKGVVIISVAQGSIAANLGLRTNDIIIGAGQGTIENVKAFEEYMNDMKGKPMLLLINRNGNTLYLAISISTKDLQKNNVIQVRKFQ